MAQCGKALCLTYIRVAPKAQIRETKDIYEDNEKSHMLLRCPVLMRNHGLALHNSEASLYLYKKRSLTFVLA